MSGADGETGNLNLEVALERVGGDECLLREIAGIFLCECPEMQARIRLAIQADDATALERAAHCLKGSVANFGFGSVFHAARELESTGRQGDLSRAPELSRVLDRALDDLMAALKSLA